ncbi:class I SAM-dependent methyltransferase [Candidatus Njordibacter sp. Uisw_056]|jgi:cyclopropane fatty-acyl-phospholipid synthase-like methyltransferase|uniref:SAM-dependent methyltransferase n=1 Tax=Candidatus Njordibacter sp. Uisw_056 TaxID=3230973 RepID=UPI003D567BAB|tara:strand:+ start:5456 stop:6040 length:585 start_codon:yes stop_codon:yes gene_type:complete
MWDQRYANKDYLFGTEPNEFLQDNVALLRSKKVLCLADGEGRNSVYLAGLGYDVTAVDSSKVGLEKAQQLAKAKGVTITTVHADLADYDLGTEQWNGIVSIFCHLPPQLRQELHKKIYPALITGGVLLLEAYTPKQLELKTGGPPVAALTMQSAQLITELIPLRLDLNQEMIRDVYEGSGHTGKGAVVQVIGVR